MTTTSAIQDAIRVERRRIERDLHDGAQQQLLSAAMLLELATRRAAKTDDDELTQLLADSVERLRAAYHGVRDLSRGIYPAALTEQGLAAAVEALAWRAPLPVELDAGDLPALDERVAVAAYFVVSEALANVAKHAHATVATVALDCDGARLYVTISDDGAGGADVSAGSGLRGLAERVETAGGHFTVLSPAGAGTTIAAVFPV